MQDEEQKRQDHILAWLAAGVFAAVGALSYLLAWSIDTWLW